MKENKLFFNSALKSLENENNFLVWWYPWNGIIRNRDGDEIGTLSPKIIDRLIESNKLYFWGYGDGLLQHEKYYKLIKNK